MHEQRFRRSNYDYTTKRAYMVTLKKHPQAEPFSILDPTQTHGLRYTSLTHPFIEVITDRLSRYFHKTINVRRFVIMPNHIHVLIYLNPRLPYPRPNLIVVVEKLITFLTEAYHTHVGQSTHPPILSNWDDSIAFTPEAYRRMIRYIEQNPQRASLRSSSSYCKLRHYHAKDGKTWWYYGNIELVKSPTILAVECSRKITPQSPLWEQWQQCARTITTGCAGIGTFMSPCEKEVMETILTAGGACIILLPEGLSPYWHPGETMEQYCAKGRILYLTPFAFEPAQASAKTLYDRCHAGGGLKELMIQLACNITAPPRC